MHLLPELLDSLLAGETPAGSLPIGSEQRRAVDAVLGDFGRICEDLAGSPFATALDHGDLHGGNVLVDGSDQRLVDWGDSCVGHPFSSLFVTYELAVSRFDPVDRAAAALRLRDAYLDPWTDKASLSTLRDTFTLAVCAGYVSRALGFAQMLDGASTALIEEWQRHIVIVLRHWQEAHGRLDVVRSSFPQSGRDGQVRPRAPRGRAPPGAPTAGRWSCGSQCAPESPNVSW